MDGCVSVTKHSCWKHCEYAFLTMMMVLLIFSLLHNISGYLSDEKLQKGIISKNKSIRIHPDVKKKRIRANTPFHYKWNNPLCRSGGVSGMVARFFYLLIFCPSPGTYFAVYFHFRSSKVASIHCTNWKTYLSGACVLWCPSPT